MAARKPYEQFGPYILFKKLESDALGDLHRAARIEDSIIGPMLAVRRVSGGDREALATAAATASQIVPILTGSSFVRDQRVELIGGTAIISHEYAAGRSLRAIMDRARNAQPPNPLPIDQAIAIAERVALSLSATNDMRFGGERLVHGALIPQFIWITEDGEIRVAGQGLGRGIVASLKNEKVAAEIGRYFAPETQHSGASSKSTEVYALGAVFYLLVTGHEPPDATRASAFTHAIRAAKTANGTPVPDDIRAVLEKSLNIDPAGRYASPADMRAALLALASSGKYSATSFNLAFYLSNLLKKEMEAEVGEREKESKVNVALYHEPVAAAAPASVPGAAEKPKSRAPLAIAATLLVAAAGAGAWFMFGQKGKAAGPAAASVGSEAVVASVVPPQPKTPVVPEPIVASAGGAEELSQPTTPVVETAAQVDEAARKKAFEDAVKKRLQQELQKLQAQYTRELQQQVPPRSTPAKQQPIVSPQPVVEERVASAAAFDQQRRESSRVADDSSPVPAQTTATVAAPPPVTLTTAPVQVTQTQPPAPSPAAPVVREGDLIDVNDLDEVPQYTRAPRPVYPPIAARQRIEATVMASVLVSETGEVLDVKVLKGDPRFGFNDAAIRAFRGARFSPPMKNGKRVRTWMAQMIQFKP